MHSKTPKQLLIAAMLVTTLPFFLMVDFPSTWNSQSAAIYFASAFGFIGVALLLWQFILGTRSISRFISKDIVWTNKLHRFLGTYGTLLIFAHPILVAHGLNQGSTYSLELGFSNEFETHVSFGRLALYVLVVVWITSALLRGKMKYRPWKYLHYIAYAALPLVFIHARDIGFSFDNPWVNAYWNVFIATFIVLLVIRVNFVLGRGKTNGQILSNELLNKQVRKLRLKTDKSLNLKPGQFVYVQHGYFGEEHPFTVVDFDNEKRTIEIAYKLIGPFTHKLAEFKKGGQLRIDGPYGSFTKEVDETDEPVVYIAGGIGITPFVHRLKQPKKGSLLLYANRNNEVSVFREQLQEKLGKNYIDVFSNQKTKGKNQETGHINRQVIEKYVKQPDTKRFFVCGPQPMMDSVIQTLQELGVDRHKIHSEAFTL